MELPSLFDRRHNEHLPIVDERPSRIDNSSDLEERRSVGYKAATEHQPLTMPDKPSRSAFIPLLVLCSILLVGTALFLLLGPEVHCPPCKGDGLIIEVRANGDADMWNCGLCDKTGWITIINWLRSDHTPSSHRYQLSGKFRQEEAVNDNR